MNWNDFVITAIGIMKIKYTYLISSAAIQIQLTEMSDINRKVIKKF